MLGTACLYWYAVTLFAQVPAVQASDAFSLALPKIALVMVGGSSVRPRQGLAWASVGFVLGEVVTQLATWQTGSAPRLDVTTLLAFALVVVTMGSAVLATDRARRAQPSLHRAAFDQQVQGIRHDMEQQAAAILHDTVLSHLAAVARVVPAARPRAARVDRRDLEAVVGQEWLGEPEPGDSPSARRTPGRPATSPAPSSRGATAASPWASRATWARSAAWRRAPAGPSASRSPSAW